MKWTPHELQTLRRYYATSPLKEMAARLPRHTIRSIRSTARDMEFTRLGRGSRSPWTQDELGILRDHTPTSTLTELQALLPMHGRRSIRQKVHELRLSVARQGSHKWSEDELKTLKNCYRNLTLADLVAKFPRHPAVSIKSKAREMGLTSPAYWSALELEALTSHYATSTHAQLQTLFPLRSWEAIRRKANEVGLTRAAEALGRWAASELEILTSHYATSTHMQLEALLPRHGKSAIGAKARQMKLTRPPVYVEGKYDAQIRAGVEQGKSFSRITREIGIRASNVCRRAKKMGLQSPYLSPRQLSLNSRREMLDLVREKGYLTREEMQTISPTRYLKLARILGMKRIRFAGTRSTIRHKVGMKNMVVEEWIRKDLYYLDERDEKLRAFIAGCFTEGIMESGSRKRTTRVLRDFNLSSATIDDIYRRAFASFGKEYTKPR